MFIEHRVTNLIEKYINRIQCIRNKPNIDVDDQYTINRLYITINYLTKQLSIAKNKTP